jgi:hypothetical protein
LKCSLLALGASMRAQSCTGTVCCLETGTPTVNCSDGTVGSFPACSGGYEEEGEYQQEGFTCGSCGTFCYFVSVGSCGVVSPEKQAPLAAAYSTPLYAYVPGCDENYTLVNLKRRELARALNPPAWDRGPNPRSPLPVEREPEQAE